MRTGKTFYKMEIQVLCVITAPVGDLYVRGDKTSLTVLGWLCLCREDGTQAPNSSPECSLD